jgi:hypothetical protein
VIRFFSDCDKYIPTWKLLLPEVHAVVTSRVLKMTGLFAMLLGKGGMGDIWGIWEHKNMD